jgi:hypothetical protein
MTPLPKHLEEMRDPIAYRIAMPILRDMVSRTKAMQMCKESFEQAASIMLKDMESMAKALEFYERRCVYLSAEDIDRTKEVNHADYVAKEALKNYREKYEVKK